MTNNAGRPTKMDEITVAKLKMAFSAGLSDPEACAIADIDKSTLYRYQKSHPNFATEKARWKNNISAQAKLTIAKAIVNHGDVQTAKWLIDKNDPRNKALASKYRYEAKMAKAQAEMAQAQADLISGKDGGAEGTLLVDDIGNSIGDDEDDSTDNEE